jgi:hypothetical protein
MGASKGMQQPLPQMAQTGQHECPPHGGPATHHALGDHAGERLTQRGRLAVPALREGRVKDGRVGPRLGLAVKLVVGWRGRRGVVRVGMSAMLEFES